MMKALFSAIALGGTAVSPALAEDYRGYETPSYSVVMSDGVFEIRDYDSHLMAEVKVRGDRNGAASKGFRTLAGYIFGGNASDEKIAMTSPVTQSRDTANSDVWTVSFMMPGAHTPDTLPDASNDNIQIKQAQTARRATIRFSGRWTASALAEKESELRTWIAAQGLTADGAPEFYFYDPPFRLPWDRRNEIALALK